MNLKFYNTKENSLLKKKKTNTPILGHAIYKNKVLYGGLDKTLYLYDVEKDETIEMYKHQNAVSDVLFQPTTNLVYVSEWQNGISVFDDRTKKGLIYRISNFGIIHSVDVNETKLLVCDNYRRAYVFDVVKGTDGFTNPIYKDEILRYPLRCIKAFPDQKGFVVSSVEGRVAWEYFDTKEKEKKYETNKYVFKCHRRKKGSLEVAYPINTIDFHPTYGTFCTGGSDGTVCFWDGVNKKRIWKTPNLKNEITKIKINDSGDEMCICVSSYIKKQATDSEDIKGDTNCDTECETEYDTNGGTKSDTCIGTNADTNTNTNTKTNTNTNMSTNKNDNMVFIRKISDAQMKS